MMYINKLDACLHAAAESAALKTLGMQCRPVVYWCPDDIEADHKLCTCIQWRPVAEMLGATAKGLDNLPELCNAMEREPLHKELSQIISHLWCDGEVGNDFENPSYKKVFLSGYVGLSLYKGLGNPSEISAEIDRLMRLDYDGIDTGVVNDDKWWSVEDVAQTSQVIREQMGAVISEAYRLSSLPSFTYG